ncbi:hypothetical protein K461DRAFT_281510 [Myriangium duriaei CBS 260.36]|uniref:RTA1 domain-containing protein n=1 Tax=Myriangium duriaei CBS 260.36 TaxID=1168546 RepID=A0A9P4MHR0_9PEZI|nr:hypothetical protein K461DRAFT_281510 [Myriangium duriaei CBS 260.36]
MLSQILSLSPRATSDTSLYPYDPVKPLPIIFAVIIFTLAVISYWQNFFHFRWFRFGFTMLTAGAIWVAGFACMAVSEYNPRSISPYIAQYVLILIGPPAFGAAETFILGRLMAYLPYHAPLHPGRVVTTFILLSAMVEGISAAGGSRISASKNDKSLLPTGVNLLNAALLLQCCVELFFLFLTTQLHRNARKTGTLPHHVKVMLGALYTTSTMILVRCIFRVVQGFQIKTCILGGTCGLAITQEALFWVFEVANITLFVTAWVVFPPGKYLPHTDKVFLDKSDGKTERMGPGFSSEDSRPWIVTVFDPFNIYGKIKGTDKDTTMIPFWEENYQVYETDKADKNRRKF